MVKHMKTPVQPSPTIAPFHIAHPEDSAHPIIIASPHSGTHYPPEFLARSRLDLRLLRRSEDAYIDELFAGATGLGLPLLAATYSRAFLDLNREAYELDAAMFSDPLPSYARAQSERIAAGLGVLPRIVGAGLDIYERKLPIAEALHRIETVHRPYHQALRGLLENARMECGYAVLLDCHSMPSAALPAPEPGHRQPQVILGDRRGRSCAPAVVNALRHAFEAHGYRVALNDPYAGGYTTEAYGIPHQSLHTVQIELDRSLYMDETRLTRLPSLKRLQVDLETILAQFRDTILALDLNRPLRTAAE